jgi:short-subunit dehydrogenase
VTETNFHAVAMRGRTVKSGRRSYPPEVVVKDALAALKERKSPVVVSGPFYRLFTFITTKLISRRKLINIMGKRSRALKG